MATHALAGNDRLRRDRSGRPSRLPITSVDSRLQFHRYSIGWRAGLPLETLLNATSSTVEFDLDLSRKTIVLPLDQRSCQSGSAIWIELCEPSREVLARADPTRVREQYEFSRSLVEEGWAAPFIRSGRSVSRRFRFDGCIAERTRPGVGSRARSVGGDGCTRASSRRS